MQSETYTRMKFSMAISMMMAISKWGGRVYVRRRIPHTIVHVLRHISLVLILTLSIALVAISPSFIPIPRRRTVLTTRDPSYPLKSG
ncbi:hypothetical protein EDD15DRAFT_2274392, partial [Pisolithus albus]